MPYDTDDFDLDVIQKSYIIPVLVDFWAEWCGPCKALGPVLEDLAQHNSSDWLLVKFNTERHPAVSVQYGIKSIPNVKLFVDGQVSDGFIGAMSRTQVDEWLGRVLPSKYRWQLDEARWLLTEGETSRTKDMLEEILGKEPGNEQALVLLAQVLLEVDSVQASKITESINVGSRYFETAQAIRTLAGMLRHLNDASSLESDVVMDTYVTAIDDIRVSSFETALNRFIEVVRKNRYYDDDGARKACVAIFHVLGEDNELTQRYRRILSSALF